MKGWGTFAGLLVGAALLTACGSGGGSKDPAPNAVTDVDTYPYVLRDGSQTAYLSVANHSDFALEVRLVFRNAAGTVTNTDARQLASMGSFRFVPAAGESTVDVEAVGDRYALISQLEIREGAGNGAALSQPAVHAFHAIGGGFAYAAPDEAGAIRSTVALHSALSDIPLYLESSYLGSGCSNYFQTTLAPRAALFWRPEDRFPARPHLEDWVPSTGCYTGPNNTGKQSSGYRQAVFATSATHRAQYSETMPNSLFWPASYPAGGVRRFHFVDVQDDGTTRADRLHFKCNGYPPATDVEALSLFHVVYCDDDGTRTETTEIVRSKFSAYSSYVVIEPRTVLGRDFKGSVTFWVDTTQATNWPVHVEGVVERLSPGTWRDLDAGAPAGSELPGAIAYVSSKDPNWNYEIDLFYPDSIHPQTAPQDPPAGVIGGTPATTPPDAQDGIVVLDFHDPQGLYKGWAAVHLPSDATRRIDVKQVASQFLGPFEGSVTIRPNVVVGLSIAHETGNAHGSTNVWQASE